MARPPASVSYTGLGGGSTLCVLASEAVEAERDALRAMLRRAWEAAPWELPVKLQDEIEDLLERAP